MSLAQQLYRIADVDGWRKKLEAMVQEYGPDASEFADLTWQYLEGRLEKLAGMAHDMNDVFSEPDLFEALVYWYVEAKCEWAQFNQRMNYRMALMGSIDHSLMLKGSLGTAILEEVEAILDLSDIEALQGILHNPLAMAHELAASRDLRLEDGETAISTEVLRSVETRLRALSTTQANLSGAIVQQKSLGDLHTDLRQAVATVEATIHEVQEDLHRLADLKLCLGRLRRRLAEVAQAKGFRATLQASIAPNLPLTRALSDRIEQFVAEWLVDVVERGLEDSPQSRTKQGKSGAVIFTLEVREKDNMIEIVLRDDGVGIDHESVAQLALQSGVDLGAGLEGIHRIHPDELIANDLLGSSIARLGDLLRERHARLTVQTRPGEGNEVVLRLPRPMTVTTAQYLMIEVAGSRFGLRTDDVRLITRVRPEDVHLENTKPSLLLYGQVYAYIELADALQSLPAARSSCDTPRSVIAMQVNGHAIAFAVDEVIGLEAAMPVPLVDSSFETPDFVTGVLNVGWESPCLVLDVHELVDTLMPPRSSSSQLDEATEELKSYVLEATQASSLEVSPAPLVERPLPEPPELSAPTEPEDSDSDDVAGEIAAALGERGIDPEELSRADLDALPDEIADELLARGVDPAAAFTPQPEDLAGVSPATLPPATDTDEGRVKRRRPRQPRKPDASSN